MKNQAKTLGTLCALTLSSVAFTSNSVHSNYSATEIGLAAMILGLNADSLACVDVQPNEIPILLDRLEQEYGTYLQLIAAQEDTNISKHNEARCNAILRQDSTNTDAQLDLENAQAEAATSSYSAFLIRQSLITTVLEDLADTEMVSEVFFVSGVFATLPAPYRLAVGTYEDAKELAWALNNELRAEQSGSTTPNEASVILGQARSQYDVSTGIIRIQQFEEGNKSAIQGWMLTH